MESVFPMWLGIIVMWIDSGFDCFSRIRPLFSIASAKGYTPRLLRLKDIIVESG